MGGWEATDHPPCSFDVIPSDFHLFGPFVKSGEQFATDINVNDTVISWMPALDYVFFHLCWDTVIAATVGQMLRWQCGLHGGSVHTMCCPFVLCTLKLE